MALPGWSRRLLLVFVLLTVAACQDRTHDASPTPIPTLTPTPLASSLGSQTRAPLPTPSPTPLPAPVVVAIRLDADHLLVTTTQDGHPTRFESLDALGGRRQLALPSPDLGTGSYPTQAFTSGGVWFVVTEDCSYAGVRLYRSDDAGRAWSSGTTIGYIGCHAGDVATLFDVGRARVLVTSSGVGEGTTITRSTDGRHWPKRPQRSDSGASTLAFQDDGSYVRVWGFADIGDQTIVRASSLASRERSSYLPGGARPLGYTLTRAGSHYVLLSTAGRPYTSMDGVTWTARTSAFPGCRCSRLGFTALTRQTWWAKVRDGKRSRYAVTRDGARSWHEVPGPPGPAPEYPDSLTAWNTTSAVVERVGALWVTTDSGRHWRRL